MIAHPTTAQLIEAARRDLEERVAPYVTDPIPRRVLDMAILVLGSAATRSAHEVKWMLDESDAIAALARELVDRLPGVGPLAEALAESERGKGDVRDIADVNDRYTRASELLARAAEAAYDAGDAEAIHAVFALFDERRRNQNTVTGGFEAVGRS